mmetsp:Transcript_15887/g.36317  ORF Transcript_15887/g.36317 Transcript_15887/m.36317 type:complete len:403 (-) Transcript_15887:2235-3443(-)
MGCLQGKEEAASKPKNPEPPKQEAVKPAPVSQMKPEAKAETKAIPRQITMKEVTEHTKDPDIWFVIHGKVYSVGDFKDHPGGFQALQRSAGKDVSSEFEAMHDDFAKKQLERFYIGDLIGSSSAAEKEPAKPVTNGSKDQLSVTCLKGMDEALVCTLQEKTPLSRDSYLFRFSLPPDQSFGLPIGQHIRITAQIEETAVSRSYTPTSKESTKGFFDLVVKVYRRTESSPGGKMSQYLESLKVGDTIDVFGPKGMFRYNKNGTCTIDGNDVTVKKFGFICGGSGITPAFQTLQAILDNPEDNTTSWLISANQKEEDILLRSELDRWAEEHSNRFKCYYTLSRETPEGWKFGSGYVNESMISEHMPAAGPDTIICLCGPLVMIDDTCIPLLKKAGFSDEQIFVF